MFGNDLRRADADFDTAELPFPLSIDTPQLHGSAPRCSLLTPVPKYNDQPTATDAVVLPPDGTLIDRQMRMDHDAKRRGNLAVAIRQRIESRIGGRIRDLSVRVSGKTIVLEGRCATYYSKQLAQHAALGVIEDENLENDIVVALPE